MYLPVRHLVYRHVDMLLPTLLAPLPGCPAGMEDWVWAMLHMPSVRQHAACVSACGLTAWFSMTAPIFAPPHIWLQLTSIRCCQGEVQLRLVRVDAAVVLRESCGAETHMLLSIDASLFKAQVMVLGPTTSRLRLCTVHNNMFVIKVAGWCTGQIMLSTRMLMHLHHKFMCTCQ